MNIIIFEDHEAVNFYPAAMTRPVWELRSGCFSLGERIRRFADGLSPGEDRSFFYYTRDYLVPLFRERYPERAINESLPAAGECCLWVNSRVRPGPALARLKDNEVLMRDGIPLCAKTSATPAVGPGTDPAALLPAMPGITRKEDNELTVFHYLWDLVDENPGLLREDIEIYGAGGNFIDCDVTITGDRELLYVEQNVRIDPYVSIDLTGGPVLVKKGAVIHSFSRIEGPCAIGEESLILGACLRGGCSIGDRCRVGGEVEQSIFQGLSNKYHDGFIGHAYIGEWVNLGAMTTNSDLKNNYSAVKVNCPGGRISTGRMKIGCFIGDFTKTGIGSLINTGANIGAGCMLVHSGRLAPRYMPSFSWFVGNRLTEGEPLSSFLSTCETVTGRRGVRFSGAFERLIRGLYERTAEERAEEFRKWKDQSRPD